MTKKNSSLVEQINKREWWHSPPEEQNAYKKRGVFLASSFREAEFYGRPLDEPTKVDVRNPIIGTEEHVIKKLFGSSSKQMEIHRLLEDYTVEVSLKVRFQLDKEMYKAAKRQGYDAIAIVTQKGLQTVKEGKLHRSVELNVLDVKKGILSGIDRC